MFRPTKGGPDKGLRVPLAPPDGRQRGDPAGNSPIGRCPGNLIRIMPAEGLVR